MIDADWLIDLSIVLNSPVPYETNLGEQRIRLHNLQHAKKIDAPPFGDAILQILWESQRLSADN